MRFVFANTSNITLGIYSAIVISLDSPGNWVDDSLPPIYVLSNSLAYL